ncbi:MAG: carboxypeptidase regulatory-like domain-containing protein [Bacillota bacterium]|jgi:hypothetical protein|nr:hypothetical protein [Bacillota bacterium]
MQGSSKKPSSRPTRRIFLRALAAVCCLLVVAVAAAYYMIHITMPEIPQRGNLAGRVTRPTGLIPYAMPGLGGVLVTAEPGGYTATTDRTGTYWMDLPAGVYTVTFSKPGREPHSEKAVITEAGQHLIFAALFPEPKAAPVAKLEGPAPAEEPLPYGSSADFSAVGSRNVSRHGIRWEVRDGSSQLLMDPYQTEPTPLQLAPSPIPGSSPLRFSFVPPAPGRYEVTLILTNSASNRESRASVSFECANTPPQAVARTVGVPRVVQGDAVFLDGWAVDENMPSPELYNPGGNEPDTYGKNHDWGQSQFSWEWRLEHIDETGNRTDVTAQLMPQTPVSAGAADDTDAANPMAAARTSQRPWFIASQPGSYVATLTVCDNDPHGQAATGSASVTVTVLRPEAAYVEDESQCARCHADNWPATGGMSCQWCHGPAGPHLEAKGDQAKRSTIGVSYSPSTCAKCHQAQHQEWSLSRHSDGYAFGDLEIARPLMLNCAKCHYPEGFATAIDQARREGVSFGEVEFKRPLFPGGPMFFDYSKLPAYHGEGVACLSCHDSHAPAAAHTADAAAASTTADGSRRLEAGLRVDPAELCGTCHEEKWQNVLLNGTAAQVGSAYEYPGHEYPRFNPHSTSESCILCHMNDAGRSDLAGHTMRMREAGPDGQLGGFGPSYADPSRLRQESTDDALNIEPCLTCHPDAQTFNINGAQERVYQLWTELGQLLAAANGGKLPGYRPGDKCATCHRGGTLPFDNDPDLVLENAYTNYKLVGNDRSWGIHNYDYAVKLLTDSIEAVRAFAGPAGTGRQ